MSLRRHLTSSNVIALLALFIAIGGGAYAAQQAKKNSVTSKSIKNGSVVSADVKDGALSGTDVEDASLLGGDVADGSLKGQDLEDGSVAGATIADGSVKSADVGDGSLTGTDVADGSLTGSDIQAGSIADATSGQTVKTTTDCVSNTTAAATCLSTPVQLGRPSRILAMADGTAAGVGLADDPNISCGLFVDGSEFSTEVTSSDEFPYVGAMSVTAVTQPLTAGTKTIDLRCHKNGSADNSQIVDPSLTTVVLGSG